MYNDNYHLNSFERVSTIKTRSLTIYNFRFESNCEKKKNAKKKKKYHMKIIEYLSRSNMILLKIIHKIRIKGSFFFFFCFGNIFFYIKKKKIYWVVSR